MSPLVWDAGSSAFSPVKIRNHPGGERRETAEVGRELSRNQFASETEKGNRMHEKKISADQKNRLPKESCPCPRKKCPRRGRCVECRAYHAAPGTKYAVLVALGIAVLDFLPVFGTGTVLVPWAIIKILNGNYTTAIILLVLWGGGQLLRQMIQPRIVGDSLGLSTLPTLILLFIGWRLSGVGGMILAVPVGLVLYNLYKSGLFDTTIDSIKILARDLSAFCKYTKQDYVHYKKYEKPEKKTDGDCKKE